MTGISTEGSILDHMTWSVSCRLSEWVASQILIEVRFPGSNVYGFLDPSLVPSRVCVQYLEMFRVERVLGDFVVSTHRRWISLMFTDPFSKWSFSFTNIMRGTFLASIVINSSSLIQHVRFVLKGAEHAAYGVGRFGMHNNTILSNDPIEWLRHALNIGHGDMTLGARVRLMLGLRIELLSRWGWPCPLGVTTKLARDFFTWSISCLSRSASDDKTLENYLKKMRFWYYNIYKMLTSYSNTPDSC